MWENSRKWLFESQEETFSRISPCWHPNLGLPVSRTMRKLISVVQATQLTVFCYGSLSRLRHWKEIKRGNVNLDLSSQPGLRAVRDQASQEWANTRGSEELLLPKRSWWILVRGTGIWLSLLVWQAEFKATPRFLVPGAHTPSSSYSVKQSSRCCYGGIFAEVIKASNQLALDRVTWVDPI